MEPGEEEWDPGGDTFNHPTAISEAAFPASGVTLPLPLKREKQGGGGCCVRSRLAVVTLAIMSVVTEFYLSYPSECGSWCIKPVMEPESTYFITNKQGVNIPYQCRGMHLGRPPEGQKSVLTSQRAD